jgi:hypothetical protein
MRGESREKGFCTSLARTIPARRSGKPATVSITVRLGKFPGESKKIIGHLLILSRTSKARE